MLHADFVSTSARIGTSARSLFERLNPRHREGSTGNGVLAVYDWEVANDTALDLMTVRDALRALDGVWLEVKDTNGELRVTALRP